MGTSSDRKNRRWTFLAKRLGKFLIAWAALELAGMFLLYASPTLLLYAGVRNGYENARFRVAESLVRPKDPGPAPDAKVVSAANGLGLRLFAELTRDSAGENVFFSPSSVATGMTMAYNGAAGHTQATMAKALGLDGIPLDEVNQAYERIQAHLAATHPRIRVANAHGLWVDEQARLVPAFGRRMEDSFGAKAEALDLQFPGAVDQINAWVKTKTNGRIDGVLDRLGRYDRLVLADAITFNGKWTNQFVKSRTRPAPFHLLDGSEKTVPMMSQKARVGFFRDREYTFAAARLPYGDGSMAMYLFVPRHTDGLPAFLKALTPERWDEWLRQFHEHEIYMALPRFRAEYEGKLNDALIAAGLGEAFDRDPLHHADFTAMAQTGPGICTGSVLHKAMLEVDEAGTRAEAVTVVVGKDRGGPPSVRADRPFFCAIRDERTGLILFAGAIYDPEALA